MKMVLGETLGKTRGSAVMANGIFSTDRSLCWHPTVKVVGHLGGWYHTVRYKVVIQRCWYLCLDKGVCSPPVDCACFDLEGDSSPI